MLDAELIFEVAMDPHLAHDVTISRVQRGRDVFDDEPGNCKEMVSKNPRALDEERYVRNATATQNSIVDQKMMLEYRTSASSEKSCVWKNE